MKTVIEMARETGGTQMQAFDYGAKPDRFIMTYEVLERFAELARADEREQGQRWFDAVTAQHKQAILAEREACAKVCEAHKINGQLVHSNAVVGCAAAIRARSNT